MPLRQGVKTLKGACLHNIALNMDTVWCEDYIKNFLDQGQYVHIVGPFEYLPSSLVHALLETLSNLKLIKRHHLHLLINPNLKQLDLGSLKPVSNTNAMVRMVNQRCSNITALNLSGCKQVSAQVLCEVAQSFPHLISLDLSHTKCSDQVCTILSHNCYTIRELKLTGCPVTSNGMVNLCTTFPRDKQKCPMLSRLEIYDTMVGLKGVKEALQNLPSLQWLEHPLTCVAIGQLHGEEENIGSLVPPEKQYKLQNLNLHMWSDAVGSDGIIEHYVASACAFCPNVSTVKMECPIDLVANSLSTLTNLHTLHLVNEDQEIFESIIPLLQLRGSNLTSLHLTDVYMLDLGVIGSLCPNLERLTLIFYTEESGTLNFVEDSHPELVTPSTSGQFSQLQELKLLCFGGSNLTSSQTVSLLACCVNLRVLTLLTIEALTDDVLEEVLKVNPLTHLGYLHLSDCNAITSDAVQTLLLMTNALSEMKLFGCREITRAHYDDYRKIIKKNNYLVNVEWD